MQDFHKLIWAIVIFSTHVGCFNSLTGKQQSWRVFDSSIVNKELSEGKTVILFGNPLYHLDGAAMKQVLESSEVAAKISKSGATLFYIEYDNWYDPKVVEFMQYTRKVKGPILAIRKPGAQIAVFYSINNVLDFEKSLDALVAGKGLAK